jgi:hypothetical protein
VVLGDDDAGDAIVDPPLLPSVQRPVQTVELAFSDQQFAVGRGNRLRSFNWTVARDHGDAASATAFLHNHEGGVPINCQLNILTESGAWLYVSAVITGVPFKEHYGRATTCQYMVVGAVLAPPTVEQG